MKPPTSDVEFEGGDVLTVGLEIHAALKTRTKMFCDSKNDPDEIRPNHNICPICLGHPGTLPVINKEAVRQVLKVGVALGGKLANFSEFDRKNYFYPDIPKGYQISQYKYPLVSGGILAGVKLTRVHLEEDTATSLHPSSRSDLKSRERSDLCSLLDFNRASVPLLELVTEPVIHEAKKAADFARELQLLLRYLKVSEANMEKGEMRVEANISIQRSDLKSGGRSDLKLGTKVEVKNLNSFKSVERAILYEMERQAKVIETGGQVVQETRGFDEHTGETFSQRQKEESHDYRYFPDPDLPKLRLSEVPEFECARLAKKLPELPAHIRARYKQAGLREEYAEIFIADERYRRLYEAVNPEVQTLAANYIASDIAGLVVAYGDEGIARIAPAAFSSLLARFQSGELSSRSVKDILTEVFAQGGELSEISQRYMQQNNADELREIVADVITTHAKVAADYKNGKSAALQFLIGQAMKASRGRANPHTLQSIFQELI